MPSTHSMLSSFRCRDQLTIPHHVAWPNSILHLHPQTVASVRAGSINSVGAEPLFKAANRHGQWGCAFPAHGCNARSAQRESSCHQLPCTFKRLSNDAIVQAVFLKRRYVRVASPQQ